MKTILATVLALGVGFAAAYFGFSPHPVPQTVPVAAAPAPAAPAIPAAAPAPVEKVVLMPAPPEETAQDILNDLLNLKLGSGNARNAALRKVVFKLETLTQRGNSAVPAIRDFIGHNVDVTYSAQDNATSTTNAPDATAGNNRGFSRSGNNGGGNRVSSRRARNLTTLQADWVVPPSLRLGLVGTLKEIGGEEAEAAMAEMLATTGRGVEVAYLAVLLEEMAPGKHRDSAVAAARDLLMNPPAIDSPDRLDELSKSYLYGVLEYFKDTTFAVNAQQMLVGKDGRLDQDAMDYLATVMKDQSVSALYAAYENPALTNQFDKMRVGREVLNYVGQNSQANALFTQTMGNPDLDSRMKSFMIMQLAGGDFGPASSEVPTDPQVAANRIGLLNSMQSQFANDPALSKLIPAVMDALQKNQPIQPDVMRGLFGGRGGGGRGGWGGNNGGGTGN